MEQNGGSCAGERSGGGGGGRAAWGEGARGPRGSPGWGLPGPAPSPSGPEPPPGRARGLSRLRAGGLLHPLPPGPTPWARGWGCGHRRPGEHCRSRSAVAVFPPREASRESSAPPGRGTEGDPPPPLPCGDFPVTPAGPERINKKENLAPRSLSAALLLRPPEYKGPPSGLPPTDAPFAPALLVAQLPGRAPRSSKMGAPGRPALLPAAPRPAAGREPSARTSWETRGGGGVSAPRGAASGAEVAAQGLGPGPELPGPCPGPRPLHRRGAGPGEGRPGPDLEEFGVLACKLRKVSPIWAFGLVFLGRLWDTSLLPGTFRDFLGHRPHRVRVGRSREHPQHRVVRFRERVPPAQGLVLL